MREFFAWILTFVLLVALAFALRYCWDSSIELRQYRRGYNRMRERHAFVINEVGEKAKEVDLRWMQIQNNSGDYNTID